MPNTSTEIKSGFFNSVEHDRLYDADDMCKPYDRIVTEGIFGTVNTSEKGADFNVTAGSGSVVLSSGGGLISGKWFELEADMSITVDTNTTLSNRVDAIFIHCDTSNSVRAISIEYRVGTGTNPPEIESTTAIKEFRIANLTVAPSSSGGAITVTDMRGTEECPIITTILQTLDASDYLTHFQEQFNTWWNSVQESQSDYDSWYSGVQSAWNTYYSGIQSTWDTYYQGVQSTWDAYYASIQSQFTAKLAEFDSSWTEYTAGKDSAWDTYISGKDSAWDTWFEATEAEWEALKADISGTGLTVTQESVTYDGSSTIAVANYDSSLSTVIVYINGLYGIPDTNYTLSADGVITPNAGINSGAVISYVHYRNYGGA